jgi:diguanylate cyclase (GGDEF)-like protein
MKVDFHFDLQTLFATQGLICLVFALGLFLLHRRYLQVKGPLQLVFTFLSAASAALIFLCRGYMPLTLNVVLSNGFLFLANLFFYHGVDTLLGIRPRMRIPALVCILALIPAAYFTSFHDLILVRAALFSAANAILICYLLVDLVAYPLRRSIVRPFIATLAFYLLVIFVRAIAIVTHSRSSTLFPHDVIDPTYMVIGIFAACGLGIFAMVLVGSEVAATIERNARRDALTDALNRRGIEELLVSELDRARRSSNPLSVAIIDVDHFKSINDAAGHAAGDDTLRSVAASISSHLRPYDACGRIGGDEFLVLLPGSQAANAAQICDRILHQVAGLRPHPQAVSLTTVSIGFTESHHGDTPETILARADRALYSAKRDGRNCAHMDLVFLRNLPTEAVHPASPVRTSSLRRPSNTSRRTDV